MTPLKTFKIYIPGEVTKNTLSYIFSDGSVVDLETFEKVVVPSKKNQQQIAINRTTGVPFIMPSKRFEKWQKIHLEVFKSISDKMWAAGFNLPIYRAKIKVLFYFPDSKVRDLSNKFETIADIMVDAGILADDKFQVLKPITLDGWVKRDKPRTEIYLSIIDPKDPEYTWDLTSPEYYEKQKAHTNLMRRINSDRKKQLKKAEAIGLLINSLLHK